MVTFFVWWNDNYNVYRSTNESTSQPYIENNSAFLYDTSILEDIDDLSFVELGMIARYYKCVDSSTIDDSTLIEELYLKAQETMQSSIWSNMWGFRVAWLIFSDHCSLRY